MTCAMNNTDQDLLLMNTTYYEIEKAVALRKIWALTGKQTIQFIIVSILRVLIKENILHHE